MLQADFYSSVAKQAYCRFTCKTYLLINCYSIKLCSNIAEVRPTSISVNHNRVNAAYILIGLIQYNTQMDVFLYKPFPFFYLSVSIYRLTQVGFRYIKTQMPIGQLQLYGPKMYIEKATFLIVSALMFCSSLSKNFHCDSAIVLQPVFVPLQCLVTAFGMSLSLQ